MQPGLKTQKATGSRISLYSYKGFQINALINALKLVTLYRVHGPCPRAVSMDRVHGSCPRAVSMGRFHGSCPRAVSTGRGHGQCPWAVSVGRVYGPRTLIVCIELKKFIAIKSGALKFFLRRCNHSELATVKGNAQKHVIRRIVHQDRSTRFLHSSPFYQPPPQILCVTMLFNRSDTPKVPCSWGHLNITM